MEQVKKVTLMAGLVFLLGISLWVRVVGSNFSPISLNFDEAALAYNAYSLMLTGKDEYGVRFPLNLRSFNDYKPAMYAYLSIPWIKVFGLSPSSIRLTSAIFGTLSLFFWWLIVRRVLKVGDWVALGLTAIIAFNPWRLHYSRVAFETNVSASFFVMAICFLLYWDKGWIKRLGFFIFGALSMYTYHAARMAMPVVSVLFLADPLAWNWKNLGGEVKKRWSKVGLVVVYFLLVLAPLFMGNNTREVFRRLGQTNLFNKYYPFAPREIREGLGSVLGTVESGYFLGALFSGRLLSYLSPRNVAINVFSWVDHSAGGISQSGMLGWLGAWFLLWGIGSFMANFKKNTNLRYLAYWMGAGILPAAVTMEWLHPLRALNFFPALEMVMAMGILVVFRKFKKLKWVLVMIIMVVISFNLQNEWNFGIWKTNGEFQPGGYREAADLLNKFKDKYKTVYLDSPHAQSYIMFLTFMKYPPEKIQKYASIRPSLGAEGFLNFNFDNFVFKKYSWPEDKLKDDFVYFTGEEVKEDGIKDTHGAKLYKIYNAIPGWWVASVITKEKE